MQRVNVSSIDPSHEQLQAAADALRAGQLVAFPTETVYGLGANALDVRAVSKIFEAKGRPATNPLIVHVTSWSMLEPLVSSFNDTAQALADAFWPGPLTIICPKSEQVSDVVTAGLHQVALRWPAHPVAQALISLAGVPVTAPSANRYTHTSPTSAEHVISSLGDRVDWVVDGGATTVGLESTVVSIAGDEVTVLRPGMISAAQLRQVVDVVHDAPPSMIVEDAPAVSPGLAKKHYAPQAPLTLVPAAQWSALMGRLSHDSSYAMPIVTIACEDGPGSFDVDWGVHLRLPTDVRGYARGLYRALHEADAHGARSILIQAPPRHVSWRAIWDRLSRAVTHDPAQLLEEEFEDMSL